MSESTEISLTAGGQLAHRRATDAASICRDIVVKTSHKIQGGKHVGIEGWQAIANVHGCVLCSGDVKVVDSGVSATGYVKRVSDGVVLSSAEGFVGDDERTWASRPEYARRAMAQTRAMSRAARSVFGHVVVLMDAGLSTTPAEEMPGEHEVVQELKPAPRTSVHTRADQRLQDVAMATTKESLRYIMNQAKADVDTGDITPGELEVITSAGRSRWVELD